MTEAYRHGTAQYGTAWVVMVRSRTLQGWGVTATRRDATRWSRRLSGREGKHRWGVVTGTKETKDERETKDSGGEVERRWSTCGRGKARERVGSSHADRNGPTEFYPTIREARRGSGPRPTAATARNACRCAASVSLSLGNVSPLWKGSIDRKVVRRGSKFVCCSVSSPHRDRYSCFIQKPYNIGGRGGEFSLLSGGEKSARFGSRTENETFVLYPRGGGQW